MKLWFLNLWGSDINKGDVLLISTSQSLSGLIAQVAKDPSKAALNTPERDSALLSAANRSKLNTQAGFAGVHREVSESGYVGSGLNLKLELRSGQAIELDIQQTLGGSLRHVSLNTNGELSEEDEARLQVFLEKLTGSVDALFSGQGAGESTFDFTNMSGVKNIELTVQQDKGSSKQRLEFEKSINGLGNKEVEAEWSRYDHLTGEKEQHNLALSKQAKDALSSYGQMDYQWVVDQVKAGMGILGNAHTGDSSIQNRVSDFFVSSIHTLFNDVQKGHGLLQELGVDAQTSKKFMGQTISALSHQGSVQASRNPNMPGQAVAEGSTDPATSAGKGLNGLPDFKAHFASKKDGKGVEHAGGNYNLAMEISQATHSLQGQNEEDITQTQNRRLFLEYESQGKKQKYEYKWQHNEALVNRYNRGSLETSYFKINDDQQGILTNSDGTRNEMSNFMARTEYRAKDKYEPILQNAYIKPKAYIERGSSVNYTA